MSCFQLLNLTAERLGNQCWALIIKVKHKFFLLSFVVVNGEGTENVDFQCRVRGGALTPSAVPFISKDTDAVGVD